MKSYPKRSKVRRNFSKTRAIHPVWVRSPSELGSTEKKYHINQILNKIFFDDFFVTSQTHNNFVSSFPETKKTWDREWTVDDD